MTFQILTPTKTRLDDVRVLSQKNRQPDENPGVQLFLSMKLSNHVLVSLDPSLKPFLFTSATNEPTATKRKDNSTGTLDGVEPVTDLPKLSSIGSNVSSLPWGAELTAMKLGIAFATTNLPLDDCRIHRMRIKPQDGGTVELKYVVDAANARPRPCSRSWPSTSRARSTSRSSSTRSRSRTSRTMTTIRKRRRRGSPVPPSARPPA